jgi:phosphocarrier protein
MLTTETEIINKLGLHARASAKLTQLAGKQVRGLDEQGHAPHQRQKHHGRDDARRRQGIKSYAGNRRVDEAEAMEALLALIADYFGEGE